MNSFLQSHLSIQQDKDDLFALFKPSSRIRELIRKALQEEIEREHDRSLSKSGYDSPNWAYMQSDSIGYRRALDMLISALKD